MAAMPLDSFWCLTQDFNGGPVSRIAGAKTLGDLMKLKPRPFGSTLEEWQHATRCLLLIVRKLLEPQPRGRPRDTARLRLCDQVRDLLRSHGVAVTKARDGRFARVLALVLDAAGESVPMDAFYLAKLAIDGVRASPRRRLPASRSRRG
jgi:hypothetical protein